MNEYKFGERISFEQELAVALKKLIDGEMLSKEEILIISCASQKDFIKAIHVANNKRISEIKDPEERANKLRNFNTMSIAITTLMNGLSVKMEGKEITPTTKREIIFQKREEPKKSI